MCASVRVCVCLRVLSVSMTGFTFEAVNLRPVAVDEIVKNASIRVAQLSLWVGRK